MLNEFIFLTKIEIDVYDSSYHEYLFMLCSCYFECNPIFIEDEVKKFAWKKTAKSLKVYCEE